MNPIDDDRAINAGLKFLKGQVTHLDFKATATRVKGEILEHIAESVKEIHDTAEMLFDLWPKK